MSIPLLKQRLTHNTKHSNVATLERVGGAPSSHAQARPTRPVSAAAKTNNLLLAAVGGLLIVSLLAIVPQPVEAQVTGAWSATPETIPGLLVSGNDLVLGHIGEKVGIAVSADTGTALYFAVRDVGTGVWTIKNSDIRTSAGIGTDFMPYTVLGVSGTIWLMQGAETSSNNHRIIRSTDDGATWAPVKFASSTQSPNSADMVQDLTVTSTIYAIFATGVTQHLYFAVSTDSGATWTTGLQIDDNLCSPTGTATASRVPVGAGIYSPAHSTVDVYFEDSAFNVFNIVSTDGGNFWTSAYTTCGGSTVNPVMTSSVALNPVGHNGGYFWFQQQSGSGNLVPQEFHSTGNIAVGSCTTRVSDGGASSPFYRMPAYASNAVGAATGTNLVAYKCATGTVFNVYVKSRTGSTYAATYSPTGVYPNAYDLDMTPTYSYLAYTNHPSTGQVFIVRASTPTAINPSSTASRTFTGTPIQGFDVDPDNNVLIVRLQSTDQILNSLNPVSLDNKGTTIHSPCASRQDGVMAYYDRTTGHSFIGFIDCPSGNTAEGSIWKIRSNTMGTPDQSGTACTDGLVEPACDIDITSSSFVNCPNLQNQDLPTRSGEIGSISAIPISWKTSSTDKESATIGFAFTDVSTGQIGVWGLQQNPPLVPNIQCKDTLSFSNPGATNQLCSWVDSHDAKDYIAGVSPSANTRAARVDISHATDSEFDMNLAPFPALGSPWNLAKAMSCAGNDAIIQDSLNHINKVHMIGSGVGQAVWANDAILANAPTVRGVAFTQNELVAAYVDGPDIHILNATVGTQSCIVSSPAGSILEMKLDSTGAGLWVASNSGIDGKLSFYDIHSCTGAAPVGTTNNGQCLNNLGQPTDCSNVVGHSSTTTSTSVGNTGGFGGGSCSGSAGGILEINNCGDAYMITFMMMAGMILATLVISVLAGGHSGYAYGSMALVGYLIGIVLCGVSPWPLAILAVLAIGLGIARVKSGS